MAAPANVSRQCRFNASWWSPMVDYSWRLQMENRVAELRCTGTHLGMIFRQQGEHGNVNAWHTVARISRGVLRGLEEPEKQGQDERELVFGFVGLRVGSTKG
jgi:hypothetical protein